MLCSCQRVVHCATINGMSEEEREGRVVASIPVDSFGHRLMLARSHAGQLTIQEAATRCGLSPQSWSNCERGKLPRDKVDVVDVVADRLAIDRDWLLHGGPLRRPERVRAVRPPYRTGPLRPHGRRPRRLDRLTLRQPA